jgi:predicted HAD superfamily Cof-like phosphohydrolase
VRDFLEKFGFPLPAGPVVPDSTVREERAAMVQEEAIELERAVSSGYLDRIGLECADLVYVVLGVLARCGLRLEPFWRRVHEANMAKTPAFDLHGDPAKPAKPKGWEPPDGEAAVSECAPRAEGVAEPPVPLQGQVKLQGGSASWKFEEGAPAPRKGEGVKHDQGKPRMELLPLDALTEVARVLTFGAVKYGPDNWRRLADLQPRYAGALLRHLAAWQRGEADDPETGLPHLAHAACCALFMLGDHVARSAKAE